MLIGEKLAKRKGAANDLFGATVESIQTLPKDINWLVWFLKKMLTNDIRQMIGPLSVSDAGDNNVRGHSDKQPIVAVENRDPFHLVTAVDEKMG